MDQKVIETIVEALERGERLELVKGRDGEIEVRTVFRKRLSKFNISSTA